MIVQLLGQLTKFKRCITPRTVKLLSLRSCITPRTVEFVFENQFSWLSRSCIKVVLCSVHATVCFPWLVDDVLQFSSISGDAFLPYTNLFVHSFCNDFRLLVWLNFSFPILLLLFSCSHTLGSYLCELATYIFLGSFVLVTFSDGRLAWGVAYFATSAISDSRHETDQVFFLVQSNVTYPTTSGPGPCWITEYVG